MVTPADSYDLRLYVVDRMASGQRAIDNLHRVYTERLDGRCTIEIVDLGEQPQRARADDIVAVPTLVHDLPQPVASSAICRTPIKSSPACPSGTCGRDC